MSNDNFSRREFIGIGAVAAGASLAGTPVIPAPLRDRARRVAPSDTVRFGIVGVGMQGSGLLGTAIHIPGVECVAASDLYDGRHQLAREITGRADLPVTRRYQDLLDDKSIDAIIAAVPDHWHRRMVVDATNAGKDIYIEKPMSHSPEDGVAMVEAVKRNNRILQVGSQRVSSQVCAKAREMIASGMLGDLMMIEGSLGRNDPCGAWEYPPPPDLSPANLDWNTWLGDAPRHAFDPYLFARWRCWKEYGTGVAGDLLVHLVSGMMFMMGYTEPPNFAAAIGGIRHWKDGRNLPDVHAVNYYWRDLPVYLRLNLGNASREMYRFAGSTGTLEVYGSEITFTPQAGVDTYPCYYAYSYPQKLRDAYLEQWHRENDAKMTQYQTQTTTTWRGPDFDELRPHLETFFNAVRTRTPVPENEVFGHHAALACHMANESWARKASVTWDNASRTIKTV